MFVNANRRLVGMKLFSHIFALELQKRWFHDTANWFCASLRNNKNILAHYLDDLVGAGVHIEGQMRSHFFKILKAFVKVLKTSNSVEDIKLIMDSLRWKFSGRDHAEIADLNIFEALHESPKLKHLWGKPLQLDFGEKGSQLANQMVNLFEHLYFNALSRLVESDEGAEI